jgi:SAM-dependent methyltransferase
MSVNQAVANRSMYVKPRVVRSYARFTELFPAERQIIEQHSEQFRGDVLDIAIGAGRTTNVLLPLASRYLGIDYAEAMVDAAKDKFANADVRCLDMRQVSNEFSTHRFDAILISFNGIDYITWEDRTTLLRSLRALLRPGGILAFSTHDLEVAEIARRFTIRPDLQISVALLAQSRREFFRRLLRLPVWCVVAWRNHRRMRRQEAFFDGYAYLNDSGENFGLLTTYTGKELQTRILEDAGYTDVQILQPWLQSEPASFNYFVCRA